MPNQKKRARRRHGGLAALLPALIVMVALVAAALALLLFVSDPLAPRTGETPSYATGLSFADADGATYAPLVLGPSASPSPTPDAPGETPEPVTAESAPEDEGDAADAGESAPEGDGSAAEDVNRLIPTPYPGDYFLPVFDRALRTPNDRAMIAIVIDDCDDVDAMTRILNIAERYDAELTLFPTGDALMKLASGFRVCVVSMGYELECRTYDPSKKDYALSTSELGLQIWRQSIATSYAVTRDYQQHFYRPTQPESAYDQRTHYFIRKLGFLGVAGYTYSYKDHDLDFLVRSLENGNIYQFDMSDESLALFESFLSEANRRGYKLVTMNELFGLEDNAVANQLTIDQQTLPASDDYVPSYYDLKLHDRTNAVYALQARLIGLGYLTGVGGGNPTADGIYGAATSEAVSAFQARVGIIATGNATAETQEKLFAQDAPFAYQ